ncbi:asparaginase [Pseudomonas sp. NMI760_13]|uniref:asparaginase n=1 Tax=Pseudomonas sp. NMI760_13 TaxID=2903147 RepID=UPI001E4E86F8|nr:asparaginase [Pseudomonas sp. NMI760_13]MCE0916638.1 asparaginase [Pseudomonas sp. NMI760_13]
MTAPRVSIASLGGTVSMQSEGPGQGVTPRLDCAALLASLPQLQALAQISTATLCLVPSASLAFSNMLSALAWASAQVQAGAQAVVLTQGTDTLEETAYFLDLLWPHDIPLIMTGAMRSASQPGADGPANLLAAVQMAIADGSRGRGVLVVINDQIHQAARVRKTASLAMAAFESPGTGAIGEVVEGRPIYRQAATPRRVLPLPVQVDHQVVLLEACLDADTRLLQALGGLGYSGLVVAGFGAGHVSEAWAEALGSIAGNMPVIIATRTGNGPTAQGTYGFIGGEIDLQARGLHMAGWLCPRKCRLLLWLLIGSGRQADLAHWLQQ